LIDRAESFPSTTRRLRYRSIRSGVSASSAIVPNSGTRSPSTCAVAADSSGGNRGGEGFAVVSASGTVCTSLIVPEYSIAGRLANSSSVESHFGPIALTVDSALSFVCRPNKEQIMVRSVSLVFAVLLMSGAALAQTYPHEDTPEDRACRFDARRFCKDDIPDQFKVGSCLQAHKDKLNRACKTVIEGHGM